MSKLEALREAQLWMFREGKKTGLGKDRGLVRVEDALLAEDSGHLSPFYWGAFILSGDWR